MTKRSVTKIPQGENPRDDFPGPRWSQMNRRQRALYEVSGGLSESELDELWNEKSEAVDDAA